MAKPRKQKKKVVASPAAFQAAVAIVTAKLGI